MTSKPGWENLHHKDIVSLALALLDRGLESKEQEPMLEQLRNVVLKERLPESAVLIKRSYRERNGNPS